VRHDGFIDLSLPAGDALRFLSCLKE